MLKIGTGYFLIVPSDEWETWLFLIYLYLNYFLSSFAFPFAQKYYVTISHRKAYHRCNHPYIWNNHYAVFIFMSAYNINIFQTYYVTKLPYVEQRNVLTVKN